MPARRRKVNTGTGDYELERGRHVEDPTAVSDVYRRFATQRGSNPLLPNFGSRFHVLRKLTRETERDARSFAFEAIQDLIDRGTIREVVVTTEVSGNLLTVVCSFKDRSGQHQHVRYTSRVG